jgi:hypothetical protein
MRSACGSSGVAPPQPTYPNDRAADPGAGQCFARWAGQGPASKPHRVRLTVAFRRHSLFPRRSSGHRLECSLQPAITPSPEIKKRSTTQRPSLARTVDRKPTRGADPASLLHRRLLHTRTHRGGRRHARRCAGVGPRSGSWLSPGCMRATASRCCTTLMECCFSTWARKAGKCRIAGLSAGLAQVIGAVNARSNRREPGGAGEAESWIEIHHLFDDVHFLLT